MGHEKTICVTTGIFPPDTGGPAKFAETFLQWCQQRGQEIELVSLTNTATKHVTFQGAKVKLISRNHSLVTRYIITVFELAKKLFFGKAVIANGLFLEVYFASLITGRKYVSKVPGDIVWERARNSGYTNKPLEEFQSELLNMKYRIFRSLFSRSLKKSRKVIVPTQQLQELCFEWGVSKDNVVVIPNSVDTSIFTRNPKIEQEFDVIIVNRLVSWKHVDEVISSCAQLGLSLAIVGDGPERNQLEALAKEQSSKTIFFGDQTQSQVLKLLQKSRCLVLNSSFEATAYSLLEARSVGLFTIATQKTGSAEVINHYIDGLLCCGDSFTLKDALRVFIQDKDFVQSACEKARIDTERRFSLNANFLRIINVIFEIS